MSEDYFAFFQEQVAAIQRIEGRGFQKLSLFGLLEALARGRYHENPYAGHRFSLLLKDHCRWPDYDRVSIVQLRRQLKEGAEEISDELRAAIKEWRSQAQNEPSFYTQKWPLAIDPLFDDLCKFAHSEVDKHFLKQNRHDKLLYVHRSRWVHEFREVSYDMFEGEHDYPFYAPEMPGINEDHKPDELPSDLIYPVRFLVKLTKKALASLRHHYDKEGIDPLSRYNWDPLIQPVFKPRKKRDGMSSRSAFFFLRWAESICRVPDLPPASAPTYTLQSGSPPLASS